MHKHFSNWSQLLLRSNPYLSKMYLLKVNDKNTRKRYELCSQVTIKKFERYHWRRSDVLIANIFHTFSECFYCWLWIGKCCLGNRFLSVFLETQCTKNEVFYFKDFFINSLLRIRSHLLKKFLIESFIFLQSDCFHRLSSIEFSRHLLRLPLSSGSFSVKN